MLCKTKTLSVKRWMYLAKLRDYLQAMDILYVSSSYLQTSSTSSIKCQTVSCIVDLYCHWK